MATFQPSIGIANTLRRVQELNPKQQALNELITKFKDELDTPLKFGASALLESTVNTITRVPWVITCDSWVDERDGKYPQYILMTPNPKLVRWRFPFRKSIVKTAAGTVSFSWRDPARGNTVFDEPILELTMQSSSLLPVLQMEGKVKEQIAASASRITPNFAGKARLEDSLRSKLIQNNFKASKGLEIFYSFLRLYNVPQLSTYSDGEPNYIRLVMNTLLFPRLVVRGQFLPEQDLEWEESSTDPTSIEWPVKLIINKLTPNIGMATFQEMLETWASAGGSNGFRVPPNEDVTGVIRNEVDTDRLKSAETAYYDSETALSIRERRNGQMLNKSDAIETPADAAKADQLQEKSSEELQQEFVQSAEVVQEKGIGPLNLSADDIHSGRLPTYGESDWLEGIGGNLGNVKG